MAWAEHIFNCAVILRTLVGIFNHQADTGTGGDPLKHARQNAHLIRFTALSGVARGTWPTSVEIQLNISLGDRNARWNTVYNTSQGDTVRFTKSGDAEKLPYTVPSHHGSLNSRISTLSGQYSSP